MSSTCPHNMANFGPIAAEIDPVVWGTPTNFNGFCVLAALLHGSQIVDVSQTLRRWTEGSPMFGRATIRLGIGPHSSWRYFAPTRWTLPSYFLFSLIYFSRPSVLLSFPNSLSLSSPFLLFSIRPLFFSFIWSPFYFHHLLSLQGRSWLGGPGVRNP